MGAGRGCRGAVRQGHLRWCHHRFIHAAYTYTCVYIHWLFIVTVQVTVNKRIVKWMHEWINLIDFVFVQILYL